MLPDDRFRKQPKSFWAYVRTISERAGYTVRGKNVVRIPSIDAMGNALTAVGLSSDSLYDGSTPSALAKLLYLYFEFRAERLNNFVLPRLMNAGEARRLYREVRGKYPSICPPPTMNKQKGKKKRPAYLTEITNTLIRANAGSSKCDYSPAALTLITSNGSPLRTLARRVDGAFPATINPVAVWEIKEYYYTTTFGSRVADGVYESLLDGMELEELRESEGIDVKHYLIIDAKYTWWTKGKSYLCRIIDMLHMGYVDEVLFGKEVAERLPVLVKEWIALERQSIRPRADAPRSADV